MKKINAILIFLISSLVITGISTIDGKIWDAIFIVVGMVAYALVGILFSIGIITTKKQGRDAYSIAFFLLLLIGYMVYRLLEGIRNWVFSWPFAIKVAVPSTIGVAIIVGIILIIRYAIINKEKLLKEDMIKDDD